MGTTSNGTITAGRAAGRPIEINRGRRVNVYLDAESLAIAERGGNVSQAIRDALKKQDNSSSPP